jgi:hypothetical protein
MNKQMHFFILSCALTVAAACKRNVGSGCCFYDSEMPHYVSVKVPKHFASPCSFNFIIAKWDSIVGIATGYGLDD